MTRDRLEDAFLRLRAAADADEHVPMEDVIEVVLDRANANLIAAAPDLLEALEAISPMLPRSLSTATWGDPAWTDALGKVELAIAKAKGEKP